MAKQDGPAVRLSGYTPDHQASGLDMMAERMYEAFMTALRDHDQSGETLRFPVVGVLEGKVGHFGRPGAGKQPVIELRFVAIEPVLDRDTIEGAPSKDTLELLHQLRDVRLGEQPALDLGTTDPLAEPSASATGGTATSRRPRRSGPAVRAGDTSVDE